jgi:hypothetical protein
LDSALFGSAGTELLFNPYINRVKKMEEDSPAEAL